MFVAMGRSTFDTCFFERYARAVIEKFGGEQYYGLVTSDRPDLQMPDGSLGIEVTRAMEESKQEASGMLHELTHLCDGDIINPVIASLSPYDRDKIAESGYTYSVVDADYVGAKEYDYWALAQPLRTIITNKVQKVDSGFYGNFSQFGLFIFCRYTLSDEDAKLIQQHIRDTQFCHDTVYETVWIASAGKLHVYHDKSNSSDIFEITEEDASEFFLDAMNWNLGEHGIYIPAQKK